MLVGGLLSVMFALLLQLGLAMHVRNTLVDAAGEGARYAAQTGHTTNDGVRRTQELAASALSAAFVQGVSARRTVLDGLDVIEVEVDAPLPVVGLLGPSGLVVRGHALVEQP